MSKKIAWGGIDPGMTGCACLLTSDKIIFHDFNIEVGSDNGITKENYQAKCEDKAAAVIDQWHHGFNVKFLIEKQFDVRKKGFNVSGKLLINYGFWRGVLSSFNCNWQGKTAQQWQKVMPGKKQKGEDTKDRVLFYARQFYPAAGGCLALKKNHNRADALLMAHYIRETDF